MAIPTSRTEFKDYCMRALGEGVLQINVTDAQIQDRIDEAISYWSDYHFDGTERTFLKHQITSADKTNGYITIPDNVIGVVNIFPLHTSSLSSANMFNAEYQFVLNNISNITDYNLTHYYLQKQHIELMEEVLTGAQPIRYNRHVNKLYIDTDWRRLEVDHYIIAECYQVLDPDTYTDMWKDRWLQNYAIAKIKYQWGSNLIKFTQLQLPGGAQFNGERIFDEAKEEIRRLEEEMIISYSLPVSDLIG